MDWHEMAGIAAGVIQVAAAVPYLRDMFKGSTRPNLVSWILWDLEILVAISAQLTVGASWSLAVLVSALIMDTAVTIFAATGWGYTRFRLTESICLSLVVVALIAWQLTSNPLIAIFFSIAADGIAYIPTFVKAYRNPYSESPLIWFMLIFTGLLGVTAAVPFNAANVSFSIYYAFANFLLWGLILIRQRAKRPKF